MLNQLQFLKGIFDGEAKIDMQSWRKMPSQKQYIFFPPVTGRHNLEWVAYLNFQIIVFPSVSF